MRAGVVLYAHSPAGAASAIARGERGSTMPGINTVLVSAAN